MTDQLSERLSLLQRSGSRGLLREINRGIEKESLRIDPQGRLARTPHPTAFGSPLTHPTITTDFSEALLEFITPVSTSIDETLARLNTVQRFVYSELGDELLWPASMPCVLGSDDDIPVARYGSSNVARMKTLYRVGLRYRYGARMQTIAGIHYNFSLPKALWPVLKEADGDTGSEQDYVTRAYFSLIRNFRRYAWLLIYLYGSAPAVCGSFLRGREHALAPLTRSTLHAPYGTSLRMGDLGYQSDAQRNLNICYNTLDNYVQTLRDAITTPHPEYASIGRDRQLAPGLLQIENEFYSPIRPKRVNQSGEVPLRALRRGGVEYIEVRCVDVNADHPLGIDADQVHFLDSFLLYCLLSESPFCNDAIYREINDNQRLVVDRGREPELKLRDRGELVAMRDWAENLLDGITDVAALLDNAHDTDRYGAVCADMRERLHDPELTPSARMIRELRERDIPYFELIMERARGHAEDYARRPLTAQERRDFQTQARESHEKRTAIEAADTLPFEEYLKEYYRQYEQL